MAVGQQRHQQAFDQLCLAEYLSTHMSAQAVEGPLQRSLL
jgi:hypothetical protein